MTNLDNKNNNNIYNAVFFSYFVQKQYLNIKTICFVITGINLLDFFVRAKVIKKNDIRDLQNCNCLHKTCTLKKICKVNELFLGKWDP